METCEIKIPSAMLKRGFWIYVIRAIAKKKPVSFYIGMTGDTGYRVAASLFSRLSKHLGNNKNNNALLKRLKECDLWGNLQTLEVVGFYLSEEKTRERFAEFWKKVSCVENHLAQDFESNKYKVISWQRGKTDIPSDLREDYRRIIKLLNKRFNLKFPNIV